MTKEEIQYSVKNRMINVRKSIVYYKPIYHYMIPINGYMIYRYFASCDNQTNNFINKYN